MTVGEALTAYRRERGIDPAGDRDEAFVVPIGPLRVLAAWRRARGARCAFALGIPFAAMQDWPMERLRQEMRLPPRPPG